MSEKSISPSTLDGIKRLAKQLKTQHSWEHHFALNEAARHAGFQNFRHAQKSLSDFLFPVALPKKRPTHPVFITAPWRDKATGNSGRETLRIELSVPRLDLMSPTDVNKHRAFSDFRNSGPDHLERSYLSESQNRARHLVCAAARALQFMDATKLRPSSAFSKALPGGTYKNEIPGHDHSSVWYDRATKRYVYVDEPYEGSAVSYANERAEWAERHGQIIARTSWLGMYLPEAAQMYLVSDKVKGLPLAPIIAALDALPAPITPEMWDGESAPLLPPFISPGAIAKEKERQTRPKSSPKSAPRNTVVYIMTLVGPQRRPNARMPIETHKEIGSLLKSILAVSYNRNGIYNPLNSVRSELDEWVQREYPSEEELPNEHFLELYYRDPHSTFDRKLDEHAMARHMQSLESIKTLLIKHYPQCAPLRTILKKLERAEASFRTWGN